MQEDSGEDEDADLFSDEEEVEQNFDMGKKKEIVANQDDIVVKLTEKVDKVIEKATRKMKSEQEKLDAARQREARIKRVKLAKLFTFFSFARITTFNSW